MSFRVDDCLEKMNNRDKDFRYMAISDFIAEIPKETFKLDAESEKKIVNKLLEMVAKDGSGDVKALAVKALGPLATHAQESQVQNMIDKLGNYLLDDGMDTEIRDISSIGLKTVIGEVPDSQTNTVNLIIKTITPRLVDMIGKADSKPEVVILCLDLLVDLLQRWGKEIGKQKNLYSKIQKGVLPNLTSAQSASRKKAMGCLAYLSVYSPDSLFTELVDHLIKGIEGTKKADHILTHIQAVASVSRTVGFRFAKHLDKLMPILFKYVNASDISEDEVKEEIRENCLQAFEALVNRCPKESDPYLLKIQDVCLEYIGYDPNYVDDESGEGGAGGSDAEMDMGSMEEFSEEDEMMIDDDDESWKVRKATTRCITGIIKTRPERLSLVYEQLAPTLVRRFKEREENVKLDIFGAFIEILRQTGIINQSESQAGESSLTKLLQTHVPNIVKALVTELKGKSLKTRPGVFQLLCELINVLPGCLEGHISEFIPGVESALGEKNTSSALKIEALVFLRVLLLNHSPTAIQPHLPAITKPVYISVADRYYKITAEALRVCCGIASVLSADGFDYSAYAPELYKHCHERLKQLDIDQEVKEAAIDCAGIIFSTLGDKLEPQLKDALTLLNERLANEVTRLVSVKAFERIASSKLKIDITPVLGDVIKHLASFLRKQNRQLKQATLATLTVIIKNFGKAKPAKNQYEEVLKELAALISDADLHLSHLSLKTTSAIVHVNSRSVEKVKIYILPKCNDLLKSSLLQGLALKSMLGLYKELVTSKSKNLSYDSLLESLIALTNTENLTKQSYQSIAQCIANLVAKNEAGREGTVNKFVADIKTAKKDNNKLLALYCIGEIGRRVDLNAQKDLKKNILSSFDSSSEEIKSAASVALGCVAVGSLSKFLPDIISEVSSNPKRQYLLLGSLREVIVRLSSSTKGIKRLTNFFDKLLQLLFEHTATEEEGTRNVVSECLGKLALVDPFKVIASLRSRTADSNKNTRACVTTAIKSAISDKGIVDEALKEHVSVFLDLLSDKEIVVRKSALLSMNYCSHHKPGVIRDLLPKYLPSLYGETVIKKELIREVDLGPFKHKVDDGIELRQAAFECMYTLLDSCLSRLDLQEFIAQLVSGLGDVYDIQMLNHLILIRLAQRAGPALVASLDNLVEPLRAAVTSKAKEAAVKQQVERNEELIRSALRAIVAITKVPDVENAPKFQDFLKSTVQAAPILEKYEAIEKEQADRC